MFAYRVSGADRWVGLRWRQLAPSGGTVTRAVRRSPSRTRSARARVAACSSVSPRWCISYS
ncbi:hypothetical protein ABT317_31715, partial [Streptomyces carpinensis]